MFLKALGLMTPLAAGGVWLAGGVSTPAAAPADGAALGRADPAVCDQIMKTYAVKAPAADGSVGVTEAMGATLATAAQFQRLDDELRSAGCPSTGGIKGAMEAVGPNGMAAKFADEMREASARMEAEAPEVPWDSSENGGWGEEASGGAGE